MLCVVVLFCVVLWSCVAEGGGGARGGRGGGGGVSASRPASASQPASHLASHLANHHCFVHLPHCPCSQDLKMMSPIHGVCGNINCVVKQNNSFCKCGA